MAQRIRSNEVSEVSFQVLNRGALMMLPDRRCKSTVSCVCASSMISRKSEVSQQSSVGSEIHRKSQCIHGLDAIRPQSVLARLTMGKQAVNFDELVPLVDLCRAGKLFEVQAWIAESKPVNPPSGHYRGSRKKTPIE